MSNAANATKLVVEAGEGRVYVLKTDPRATTFVTVTHTIPAWGGPAAEAVVVGGNGGEQEAVENGARGGDEEEKQEAEVAVEEVVVEEQEQGEAEEAAEEVVKEAVDGESQCSIIARPADYDMDQSIYSSVSAGLEPRSADVRGEDEDVQEVGHGEQRVREVDPRADREVESDPFSEATTFRSDQVHPLGSWFSVFRSDSSSPAPSTSTNEEVEERSFRAPSVDSLFVEFDDRELAAREREGSGEVVAEPEAEPLESSEPRHQKRPSDQRPSDDVIASKKARTLHHFSVVNITVHLPENDSHPELLHLLAEIGPPACPAGSQVKSSQHVQKVRPSIRLGKK
eukprot:NP_497102.1 Uncharacterized protein CELE_Y53F4B.17 [Caenorhabditis elegans]